MILQNGDQVIVRDSRRILQKVDSSFITVGIINEFADSINVVNGEINLTFDSNYNPLIDRPSPIISLPLIDDAGNNITWASQVIPPSKANTKLISSAGGQPPYTISPILNDSSDLGYSSEYNFTGSISSSINNGFPVVNTDSSEIYEDGKWNISVRWSDDIANISNVSTLKAIKNFGMGTPAIRYTTAMNTNIIDDNITGIKYNNDGSKLFTISNSTQTVNSYNLNNNYDITSSSKITNLDFDSSIQYNIGSFTPNEFQVAAYEDLEINDSGSLLRLVEGSIVRQFQMESSFYLSSINTYFKDNYYIDDRIHNSTYIRDSGQNFYSFSGDNQKISSWNMLKPYDVYSLAFDTESIKQISTPGHSQTFRLFSRWVRFGNGTRAVYANYTHRSFTNAVTFSSDGRYIFGITGKAYDTGIIWRKSLSTSWDISSSGAQQSINHDIGVIPNQKNISVTYEWGHGPCAMVISPDGTKIHVLDNYRGFGDNLGSSMNDEKIKLHEYTLSVPFDLNSNVTKSNSFELPDLPVEFVGPEYNSLGTQIGYSRQNHDYNQRTTGMTWNHDGSKLFISNHVKIYEYSAASNYDITNLSYITDMDFPTNITTDNSQRSIQILGDKFYISTSETGKNSSFGYSTKTSGQGAIWQYDYSALNSYNLVPPFLSKQKNITQETQLKAIAFNSAGTKMYLTGSSSRDIHEYTLSDPSQISTAVYTSSLDTSSLLSDPQSLVLSADETKLFVGSGNSVYQYTLSNPLSSSSFDGILFNVTGLVNSVKGMQWNSTGNKFIVAGSNSNGIETYETKNNYRVIPL